MNQPLQQIPVVTSLQFCKQINANYKSATDLIYRSALSTVLYVNLSTLTTNVSATNSNWMLQISSLRPQ